MAAKVFSVGAACIELPLTYGLARCVSVLQCASCCRWSAAEIYDTASGWGRQSLGPWSPRSSTALALSKQHGNNRSMRNMQPPSDSRVLDPTLGSDSHRIGVSLEQGLMPEHGKPAGGQGSVTQGNVLSAIANTDLQQLPEGSAPMTENGQPGSSGAQCRRRGSGLSPRLGSDVEHPDGRTACLSEPLTSPRAHKSAALSGVQHVSEVSEAQASSPTHMGAALSGESEVSDLLESRHHGLTFVLSHCVLRAAEGSGLVRRLLIENVYRTLEVISFDPMNAWANISTDVLDIQITYSV